jgi:hypothetical protein
MLCCGVAANPFRSGSVRESSEVGGACGNPLLAVGKRTCTVVGDLGFEEEIKLSHAMTQIRGLQQNRGFGDPLSANYIFWRSACHRFHTFLMCNIVSYYPFGNILLSAYSDFSRLELMKQERCSRHFHSATVFAFIKLAGIRMTQRRFR